MKNCTEHRTSTPRTALLVILLSLSSCASSRAPTSAEPAPTPEAPTAEQKPPPAPVPGPSENIPSENLHQFSVSPESTKMSLAYQWLDVAEEATARSVDLNGARPTVLSRTLAIWATAMFDAWAAYDETAVGTRLGSQLRQSVESRTEQNKKTAISYASYHSLLFVYPESKDFLREQMKRFGYDPDVISRDPLRPEGIGFLAADAVIQYRKSDGANQFGDAKGSGGVPYADYTGYRPVNTADRIINPDRWQPITFTKKDGTKFTPGFLTPHWHKVKPLILESAAQFRPEPPPTTKTNDALLREQTESVLSMNANLTKSEKAEVEFMRDGPRSTGQSGHWLRFAQDLSRRDHYALDQDVKLFFTIANVAFDAFISCWETKRFYDSSRPYTLVRHYKKGQKVTGWAGPEGGTKEMPGEEWHPYSPDDFITPPFPGYTSGHATVSGACAKTLELFSGSDRFGFIERRAHCALTENQPGEMMTLDLPTFSQTAEMAARSRALGGYHIPIDNDVGLRVGREIATYSFPKYQEYFNGTAKVRP